MTFQTDQIVRCVDPSGTGLVANALYAIGHRPYDDTMVNVTAVEPGPRDRATLNGCYSWRFVAVEPEVGDTVRVIGQTATSNPHVLAVGDERVVEATDAVRTYGSDFWDGETRPRLRVARPDGSGQQTVKPEDVIVIARGGTATGEPETLGAFKARLYETARAAAVAHGHWHQVEPLLTSLGVTAPAPTVESRTVSITVQVPVEVEAGSSRMAIRNAALEALSLPPSARVISREII